MLCTSGFMDDVTFGRNGPYMAMRPVTYYTTSVAILRRSLMSINALYYICYCVALNHSLITLSFCFTVRF